MSFRQDVTLRHGLGARSRPIHCLVERYETLAARVRNDIRTMAEIGEPASEDLRVQMLRGLEADLWFLERHGQV